MTVTILSIGTSGGRRLVDRRLQEGTVDSQVTVTTEITCEESCSGVNTTASASALEESAAAATGSTVTGSTSESVIASMEPSSAPSSVPSSQPSAQPSAIPSVQPSNAPSSQPSSSPSDGISMSPTSKPTLSLQPTYTPFPFTTNSELRTAIKEYLSLEQNCATNVTCQARSDYGGAVSIVLRSSLV